MIKNILLYTHYSPSDTSGGVEHVTYSLAKMLLSKGLQVSVMYKKDSNCTDSIIECVKLPSESEKAFAEQYICDKNIQLIIVQGKPEMVPFFKSIVKKNPKIVYVHHGDPGYGYTTSFFFKSICG